MKYPLIIACIIFATNAFSQYRSNDWVFGDSIYIHFNGNTPPLINQLSSDISEPNASVSDSLGNLIFYTGGRLHSNFQDTYIYNSIGDFMGNSSGILGHASATQGSIIIPFPANQNLFYVFVINYNPPLQNLYYNIIDRTLNGGLGGVTQKNILLCDSTIVEAMNAVKHANGRDWWLSVHQGSSSNYLLYLITPAGISGPFAQSIGLFVTGTMGEAVFSENGGMLIHVIGDGQLQLMNFDRCTGILSNCQQLGDLSVGNYGCSFSSGGARLYVSDQEDSLFQYDLLAPDIKASRALIYSINDTNYFFGQHQLAEDGKIYITSINASNMNTIDSISTSLSVISSPDSLGLSCNFMPFSILLDQRITYAGLPNNPNYALGPLVRSICDSLSTSVNDQKANNTFSIYPNPAEEYFTVRSATLQKVIVTVTDVNGSKLIEETMDAERKTFFIKDLPVGIYIVNIQTDATHHALKLVRINKE